MAGTNNSDSENITLFNGEYRSRRGGQGEGRDPKEKTMKPAVARDASTRRGMAIFVFCIKLYITDQCRHNILQYYINLVVDFPPTHFLTMLNLAARNTFRNSVRFRMVTNPGAQTSKRTLITLKDKKVSGEHA